MALLAGGRPIRTVLRWQVYATVASAVIAASLQGSHGAISALLGGFINVAAGAVFGWVAGRGGSRTAGEALYALLRAEASKLVLIVLQLWAVLAIYKNVVLGAFFGTFFLTVILFAFAFIARER